MGLLRLILALSVVLAHVLGPSAPVGTGGAVSVQCFYIVSGFLIALILNEKYIGSDDVYLFYSNRFLRIFPLYWIFLGLALIVNLAIYVAASGGVIAVWHDNLSRLSRSNAAFLILTNLFLFGQDDTLFLRLGGSGLEWTTKFWLSDPGVYGFMFVPQAWSLGLELVFYLIAPFVVRRTMWTIGFIAAACLAARTVGYVAGLQYDPWSYRFFPFELSSFLAGTLSYHIGRRFKRIPPIAKIAAFGVIPAIILFPLYDHGSQIFFAASRISLYVCLVAALPMLYRLTKDAHLDRIAGDLSYPVYLGHLIPIQLLVASGVLASQAAARVALVVAVSVALAAIATRFVEIPIDNFRQRRMRLGVPSNRADDRARK